MSQDPLKEIRLEHLTFDEHFELKVAPPRAEAKIDSIFPIEESSLPTQVVGEVIIKDVLEPMAPHECPQDAFVMLEEKTTTKEPTQDKEKAKVKEKKTKPTWVPCEIIKIQEEVYSST